VSWRALALIGCGWTCLAQGADEPVPIETTLIAEVRDTVQLASGQQVYRFVPAKALTQGQIVYYTVRIRNPTPVVARGVEVVRRIPANTFYVPGSAAGPGAQIDFSADGGQTFAPPSRVTVTDGSGSRRAAKPEDYTHIRWRLRNPLAPGALAHARFRAVFQ
jgi:uncharacterized repeat protein (TIGR01451 family)